MSAPQSSSTDPAPAGTRKPRRGDTLEVEVEGYAAGGGLWAPYADATGTYRLELRRGVPGERARARVLARHGHDLRARLVERLAASPDAVEPACAHFPDCGGCSHQDLAYARQLEEKRRVAERILAGHGLLSAPGAPTLEACIGCDDPWRYRNRMDFTFGSERWVAVDEPEGAARDFALGLHPAGQWRKVLDVDDCRILFEAAAGIVEDARGLAREQDLSAWDLDRQEGLLRHLVLRRSCAHGTLLANLVTSGEAPERIGPYVAALLDRRPEITTFVQTIHSGVAKTTVGERELTLHGTGTIVERLGGLDFRLSARSFFQTNTRQAERLVAEVLAAAAPLRGRTVHDLYCGVGALTLALAAGGARAVGVELVPEALGDARANAALNGLEAVELHCGDVARTIQGSDLPPPDVVVVDPPRGGLHRSVVEALRDSPARRLVYVSCRVQSAARDAAALRPGGWRLTRVLPIDLFPHTPHLECVLTLERSA